MVRLSSIKLVCTGHLSFCLALSLGGCVQTLQTLPKSQNVIKADTEQSASMPGPAKWSQGQEGIEDNLSPDKQFEILGSSNNDSEKSAIVDVEDRFVTATGYGESVELAKLDAIRNALSAAYDQLIFVERQITDDDVRKDVIITTMNGFVKDIEIVQAVNEQGFFRIIANVTITGRALESYIAEFASISTDSAVLSKVDSGDVMKRIERARELNRLEAEKRLTQWNSAHALLEKLMDGYPAYVMEARLSKLAFNERVPDILQLKFSYALSDDYAESARELLNLVSQLTKDSGRDSVYYICPSVQRRLSSSVCMHVPNSNPNFLLLYGTDKIPSPLNHKLLVPVFDQFDRYVDCIVSDLADGGELDAPAFGGRVPISRYPATTVAWVGDVRDAKNSGTTPPFFEKVLFFNGLDVESSLGNMSNYSWSIDLKEYSPKYFNEKKTRRAESFYPFVVLETAGSIYLNVMDKADGTSADVGALCRTEGERRHLSLRSLR